MSPPYPTPQDDKNAAACYDMLDSAPIDSVIAKFGLRQTLRSLAQSLEFHASDQDEPLLKSDEAEIAADAAEALHRLANS